jgi:hypothetical protein
MIFRPSNKITAFGEHEWFASDKTGSKQSPTRSLPADVARKELVDNYEIIRSYKDAQRRD